MSKSDARDTIISVPYGGERTYLRWFTFDAGRGGGHPDVGWGTNRDEALRMTHNGAAGARLLLGLFGDQVLVERVEDARPAPSPEPERKT